MHISISKTSISYSLTLDDITNNPMVQEQIKEQIEARKFWEGKDNHV